MEEGFRETDVFETIVGGYFCGLRKRVDENRGRFTRIKMAPTIADQENTQPFRLLVQVSGLLGPDY